MKQKNYINRLTWLHVKTSIGDGEVIMLSRHDLGQVGVSAVECT